MTVKEFIKRLQRIDDWKYKYELEFTYNNQKLDRSYIWTSWNTIAIELYLPNQKEND